MRTFLEKFASRKFLMSLAAFLGSIATSVAGYAFKNDALTVTGIVCSVLSAAIYAGCEAYVDGQSLSANQTTNTTVQSTVEQITKKASPDAQK